MKSSGTGFIRNAGQVFDADGNACPNVLYKLENNGVDIFITNKGLTYSFNKWEDEPTNETASTNFIDKKPTKHIADRVRTDWNLLDANISTDNVIEENQASDAYYNFYTSDLGDKATHLFKYQKLTVKNIYPGIDWVLRLDQEKGLKYDFIVHANANPASIKIQITGAETLALANNNKTLVIENRLSSITDQNLIAYQSENKTERKCSFNLKSDIVSFNMGDYETDQDLIIDPLIMLPWATYYGGVNNEAFTSVCVKNSFNRMVVVGYNLSGSFPSTNYKPSAVNNGDYDAVIAVFNTSGVFQWAGYLGSSKQDRAYDVAIDNNGNYVVVGITYTGVGGSPTMPYLNAGGYFQNTAAIADGWIARITTAGAINWCTLLGGNSNDHLDGVSIDPTNNDILVAGTTESTNLPVQQQGSGYYQPTVLGPQDVLLAKFQSSTTKKLWCTYFGGTGGEGGPLGIANDANGYLYLAAYTGGVSGTGFPLLSKTGAYNQATFGGMSVSVFDNLTKQLWCTYWGTASTLPAALDVDPSTKDIYICGWTGSGLTTLNPGGGAYYQAAYGGGNNDGFVTSFTISSYALNWSTYLGSTANDYPSSIAVGPYSGVVVVGNVTPITPILSSYQMQYVFANTGPYNDNVCNILTGVSSITSQKEGFISYFAPNKALQWSTFYGIDGADEQYNGVDIDGQNCFIAGLWQKDCVAPINNDYTVNPGGGAYFQSTPGGTCTGSGYSESDGCIIKLYANDIGIFKINDYITTDDLNYSNDNQSITFNFNSATKSTVQLIDVTGKIIYNNEAISQPAINIANYPQGIYLLLIENNGAVVTKKFFKN
jgi:hypothetical protein